MRTPTKNRTRVLLAFLVFLASRSLSIAAESSTVLDAVNKPNVWGGIVLESTARPERRENVPASPQRNQFKNFGLRSCKTFSHGAPNTSWPARGEAAISFCRP